MIVYNDIFGYKLFSIIYYYYFLVLVYVLFSKEKVKIF